MNQMNHGHESEELREINGDIHLSELDLNIYSLFTISVTIMLK